MKFDTWKSRKTGKWFAIPADDPSPAAVGTGKTKAEAERRCQEEYDQFIKDGWSPKPESISNA